jgi:hypothetical protein
MGKKPFNKSIMDFQSLGMCGTSGASCVMVTILATCFIFDNKILVSVISLLAGLLQRGLGTITLLHLLVFPIYHIKEEFGKLQMFFQSMPN